MWVLQKQYYLNPLLSLSYAVDLLLVREDREYHAAAQNYSRPGESSQMFRRQGKSTI